MLTLEETGWNFKAIKIYSFLNFLPMEIDGKTGKIRRQSSKIRIFLWRLLFSLVTAHSFYIFGRLVQSTMIEPEKYFRWDHFVIHVPQLVGYSLLYYTGFCLFEKSPEEGVMVWNQLFLKGRNPVQKMMDQEQEEKQDQDEGSPEIRKKSGSGSGSISGVSQCQRPLLTWPLQYSLDELLAKTFPLIIQATQFFVMVVFAADPSRPQLLYSSLPAAYQNWHNFLGLLAVEAIYLTVVIAFALFSISSQLLFFSKCQAEFKELELQLGNLEEKFQRRPIQNRDIQREIWILRQLLKEMKQLEMFIELFNRSFPPCIFAFKLLCLSASILLYFFTIRHFQDFPLLAVFTGYISVAFTLEYGILYQKAFSIPQKMKSLKNKFLLSAHKTTSTSASKSTTENNNENPLRCFRAEMKREIGGIRDVGVKVGSFHTLERESTPTFTFVVKNVVNLLVTFPG